MSDINKNQLSFKNFLSLMTLSLLLSTRYGHTEGLENVKNILETFKSELFTIVPILAAVALVFFAVAYMMGSIERDTFIRWAAGLILAGSASKITEMLFMES